MCIRDRIYCGLCKQLSHSYGPFARLTLSYDFTFLALLDMALKDESPQFKTENCLYNPLKKKPCCVSCQSLHYSASVAMLIYYYKMCIRDSYKAEGGELSLSNWRRENVNTLVQQVYRAVKETKSSAVFGISPQGNKENNYNKQLIDVAQWLANEGYVDYICPQVYFGFENESAPFQRTVEEWDRMVKSDSVKLYIGIAPYLSLIHI